MMSSANIVAEIQFELFNERAEEPWTCKYVTLLQSFHRGTLSVIHWYIAQFFSLQELKNHVLVDMLLCFSHFTEVH